MVQWHALSKEEQAKYYDMARRERQIHMQMYPGWNARDNYGMMKKKKRKKEKSVDGGTVRLYLYAWISLRKYATSLHSASPL